MKKSGGFGGNEGQTWTLPRPWDFRGAGGSGGLGVIGIIAGDGGSQPQSCGLAGRCLYLQTDASTDHPLVLCDRVPPRELAILLCNKSSAFYSLGKWNEAFVAAKESLQWDPTYVKVG